MTLPSEAPARGEPAAPSDGGSVATADTASRPTPWLTYGGFGVGAAGVLVGSVTGALTLSKASGIKSDCEGNQCPPSREADGNSAKSLATVSNVSFAIGAIGIGVGIYGLLSGEGGREEAATTRPTGVRVRPVLGLGTVGIVGGFE